MDSPIKLTKEQSVINGHMQVVAAELTYIETQITTKIDMKYTDLINYQKRFKELSDTLHFLSLMSKKYAADKINGNQTPLITL